MTRAPLIALVLAATTAVPALAAGPGHAWQVGNDSYHLTVSDQDLSSPAGRAVVLARVETVAARLCRNAGVRREELACRDKIVRAASGSLRPVIEQALAERAGRPALELAVAR